MGPDGLGNERARRMDRKDEQGAVGKGRVKDEKSERLWMAVC